MMFFCYFWISESKTWGHLGLDLGMKITPGLVQAWQAKDFWMDLLKRPLIVAVDGVKPESILRFDDRSIFTGVPCTQDFPGVSVSKLRWLKKYKSFDSKSWCFVLQVHFNRNCSSCMMIEGFFIHVFHVCSLRCCVSIPPASAGPCQVQANAIQCQLSRPKVRRRKQDQKQMEEQKTVGAQWILFIIQLAFKFNDILLWPTPYFSEYLNSG